MIHLLWLGLVTALTAWPSIAFAAIWKPAPGTTFEWILQNYDGRIPGAKAIDLDLNDTTKAQVTALRAAGKTVICYISFGSWENWRPDKSRFPASVIGKPLDGWPGERWLDIRQIATLAPIYGARLDLCKAKGFRAVEPDNLDAYENDTGFPTTRVDQIRYLKWIASAAHARGLSVGLKNVPELAPDVIGNFDWALAEDCFAQRWCSMLSLFINTGKAVFSVEYTDNQIDFTKFCARMTTLHFSPLYKRRSLSLWSRRCPGN